MIRTYTRIKIYLKFLRSLTVTNYRLLRGMRKLTKLPQPAISIFGGNRLPKDSIHTEHAFQLAKKLTLNGFSIITGGGLGIMEAANKGSYQAAQEKGLKIKGIFKQITSLGITLTSFKDVNPYTHDVIFQKHFFTRKWLLVQYSVGFIFFPGGFGTLDEFFEVLTLEQCNKMQKIPIILFNKHYWDPIIYWAKSRALENNLINKDEFDLIHITSDVDEAYSIIEKYCKNNCDIKNRLYNKVN